MSEGGAMDCEKCGGGMEYRGKTRVLGFDVYVCYNCGVEVHDNPKMFLRRTKPYKGVA